jgi:NAD(P)H-dependent FMN reductase
MTTLFFAGSLRADSVNKKYVKEALRLANELSHEGEFIDLKSYPLPVFDEDIQNSTGFPAELTQLAEKISAADALVISTPEYNGSIPGNLKNLIDWLSRLNPMPLADKSLLLLAASPGPLSGVRGLWHTRVPFEAVGVHVYPNMVGLGGAFDAFDAEGKLKDEKKAAMLKDTLAKFLNRAKA